MGSDRPWEGTFLGVVQSIEKCVWQIDDNNMQWKDLSVLNNGCAVHPFLKFFDQLCLFVIAYIQFYTLSSDTVLGTMMIISWVLCWVHMLRPTAFYVDFSEST